MTATARAIRRRGWRGWILPALLVGVAAYTLPDLHRGWVPHDEGTLAQPAVRILLDGELPHRDFDDVYTGGQALYHAAVFRVLGIELGSLRWALFGAFLLHLALLWYIARRFAGPAASAGAVLLAAAWGIPVYPAAMPSWYNLFLAVGAVAACVRHLDTGRRSWLVVAGVCAGCSILVKVAGLYLVAALLLFVVYREQQESMRPAAPAEGRGEGAPAGYGLFVTASLALFVAAVVLLVSRLPTPATVLHFVVPPGAVAAWLVIREWRGPARAGGRLRRLLSLAAPVLAGVALPVAAFLVPYAASGALADLWRGNFVLPTARFAMAARLPPPVVEALPLAALALAVAWVARAGFRAERVLAGIVALALTAVLVLAGSPGVYRSAWWLVRPLVPVLTVAAVLTLGSVDRGPVSHRTGGDAPAGGGAGLFLLTAATALVGLVQFPTSGPVYFFYVGPLAAVLGLAVVARLPRPPWLLVGVIAAFHVAFAVRWIHPGWIYQMGERYAAHPPTGPLELERAGIRVVAGEKAEMEELVALLRAVSPEPWVYVTPDAPEVTFLAGKRNPTRTLFDFFEDPEGRDERILARLDRGDVGAVVLNTGAAQFSGLPPIELQRRIAERFPRMTTIGRFVVRWKAGRGPETEGPG